jgi:hypothetical protein
MSLAFDVEIVQVAGELAFDIDGIPELVSNGEAVLAPFMAIQLGLHAPPPAKVTDIVCEDRVPEE